MYSEKFDNAQVAYCKWLKSSKQFAELIKTIEVWMEETVYSLTHSLLSLPLLIQSSALCKGLPISSYMLCPIQRIPRYKLLLEGIHCIADNLVAAVTLPCDCRVPQASSQGTP